MIKGERRKARKMARLVGQPLTADLALDRGDDPCDFGPERNPDGTYNLKRARALERYARMVYDRD